MELHSDNLSRWRYYLSNITSPDIYIDVSFYYLMAACLQRRVYLGSDEMPLFANIYVILVGPPGVGKNLVIRPVAEMLKHHKLRKRPIKPPEDKPLSSDELKQQLDILLSLQLDNENQSANMPDGFNKPTGPEKQKGPAEEPLLIPIAADATTYEALVRNHSRSLRSICSNSKSKLVRNGIYTHSSICFALEEVSSLFKKHQENVINYLLKAYDCGDYIYETKNQGIDRVKSMCLNLIAGTTPAFMKSAFNDKILNEGFSSRSWFVFATKNRFERFEIAGCTTEQLEAKQAILDHIERLSKLFGQVTYTPAAHAFLKHYVEHELPLERSKSTDKTEYYYSRKNMHVQKLAMAIHFSDSLEMIIDLPVCLKALEILAVIEKNMEEALNVGGRNPLGPVVGRVERYIRNQGPAPFSVIWGSFFEDTNQAELTEVLNFLLVSGRIYVSETNGIAKYYAQ